MTEEKYDIYLSYSYQDKYWVSQFAKALEDAGLTTWSGTFTNLSSGKHISEHIQKALIESAIMIMIISPNSFKSKWNFFELGAAIGDQKGIIIISIGDIDVKDISFFERYGFDYMLKGLSPSETGKKVGELLIKIKPILDEFKYGEIDRSTLKITIGNYFAQQRLRTK